MTNDQWLGEHTAFVNQEIGRRARRMSIQRVFRGEDPEDLGQDLTTHVLEQFPHFDKSRGRPTTFIKTIIQNKVVSMVRYRTAKKRSATFVAVPEGFLTSLAAEEEAIDLVIDTRAVTSTLDSSLQTLCDQVPDTSVSQIARESSVSRHRVTAQAGTVREVFVDKGLAVYVELPTDG